MNARTWKEFAWPEWVPQELRAKLESAWSEADGRGPRDWEKNTFPDGHALGTRGGFWLPSHEGIVVGRYVHAWNNLGFVVDDEGNYFFVGSRGVSVEEMRARLSGLPARIRDTRALSEALEAESAVLAVYIDERLEARP